MYWVQQDECGFCKDLGIIRVVDRSDNLESLMLCECREGHRQTTALPRWSREWGALYERTPCPLDWFKPAILYRNPDGSVKLEQSMQSKMDYWRAKISIAQGYWKQLKEESAV